VSERRTYINLLIVFFLCGLWHGAQWVFVAWGLYHGVFLIAERAGWSRVLTRSPRALRHIYTIVVVLGGWVLFRAPGIRPAIRIWMALAGLGVVGSWRDVAPYVTPTTAWALAAGLLFSLPILPWLQQRIARVQSEQPEWGTPITLSSRFVQVAVLVVVFITSFMWLAAGTYNPFIYYRF
jgi:alginate O-acetyltransferase complex protein AlgI